MISNNIFSICLNKNKNGILSLGDINYSLNKNKRDKIYYMKYDSVDNLYRIQINDLIINNKNILNTNISSIIDFASSFTILPSGLYKKLTEEFLNNFNKSGVHYGKFQNIKDIGYCSIYPDDSSMNNAFENHWSNISINFGNFIYEWKPKNYFFNYSFSYTISKACFGFLEHNESFIILGNNFFNGYDVIFDRNNKKIGLIESECELFNNENEKIFNLEYKGVFFEKMNMDDFSKFPLKGGLNIDDFFKFRLKDGSLNIIKPFFSIAFLIVCIYICYKFYQKAINNYRRMSNIKKKYANTLEFT